MKITDVLGCVGWAFLFLLAGSWIPFLGPFLSLLTPLPFLFYSVKLDFLRGLELTAVSVLTLGLIAQLLGRPQVILFTLEFGIVGLALSECYRRKYSFGYTVLFGTLIMLGIGFFSLFFVALSKNMGPFEMVLTYVQGNLDETLKSYEQLGMGQEQASELQFYGKILLDVIRKIYPALMIVGTGFIVWLNVALSLPLLRIRKLNGARFRSNGPLAGAGAPGLGRYRFGFRFIYTGEQYKIGGYQCDHRFDGDLPFSGIIHPDLFFEQVSGALLDPDRSILPALLSAVFSRRLGDCGIVRSVDRFQENA